MATGILCIVCLLRWQKKIKTSVYAALNCWFVTDREDKSLTSWQGQL